MEHACKDLEQHIASTLAPRRLSPAQSVSRIVRMPAPDSGGLLPLCKKNLGFIAEMPSQLQIQCQNNPPTGHSRDTTSRRPSARRAGEQRGDLTFVRIGGLSSAVLRAFAGEVGLATGPLVLGLGGIDDLRWAESGLGNNGGSFGGLRNADDECKTSSEVPSGTFTLVYYK